MTPSQPMNLVSPSYSSTSTSSTVVALAQSRRPSIIAMAPASIRTPKPITSTSTISTDNGIGPVPGPSRQMIQYCPPPPVEPIPMPRTMPSAPSPPPPSLVTPSLPQDEAEDLSMRSHAQYHAQFVRDHPMNKRIVSLLQFCEIVLKYVRYPEAFEDEKPKTAPPRKRKPAGTPRKRANKAKPIEGNMEGIAPPAPVLTTIRKPRQRKSNMMKEQLLRVDPVAQQAVPIVPFIKEEPVYEEAFSDYYKFDEPLDMPLPPEPPVRTTTVPKANEKPKKQAVRRRGGANKSIPVVVIEEENTNGKGPADKSDDLEEPNNQPEAEIVEKPVNGVGEKKDDSSSSSSSSSNGAVENDNPNGDGDEMDYEEDGGEITCFCGEAYGGRAMIECESCLQWLHLKCARISNKHIPDTFVCNACVKPSKRRRRPSGTAKRKRGPNRKYNRKAAKNSLTNGNGPAAAKAHVPPPPEVNPTDEVHENGLEEMNGVEEHVRKDSVIKNGRGRRKSSPFSHLKASLTGMSNGNSAAGSSDDSVFSNGNGNGHVAPKAKKVKTEHLDFTPSPKPVPRRRPTINSASSGLYNDSSLLPLALQFHLNLYSNP